MLSRSCCVNERLARFFCADATSYPGHQTAFSPRLHCYLLSGEVEAEKDKVYSGNEIGADAHENINISQAGMIRPVPPCSRFREVATKTDIPYTFRCGQLKNF